MQLRYTITESDFTAFTEWHYENSGEGRNAMRRMYLLGFVIFVALALMGYNDPDHGIHEPVRYAMYLGVTAAALIVIYSGYLKLIRPMIVRGLARTGRFREMLGETSMRIEEDRIHIRNPHGSGRMKWRDVERIAETPGHFFLVLGPMQAFIIPKRAIQDAPGTDAVRERIEACMRQTRE